MKKRRHKKIPRRPKRAPGEKPERERRSRALVARFLILFFACWAVLLIAGIRFGEHLLFLNAVNAKILFYVLKGIGFEPFLAGSVVTFGHTSMEIITECTGLQLYQILLSLVIAFPSSLKLKLAGFGLGFVFVVIINTVRLVVIALVLWRWPQLFQVIHQYVWQVILIGLVLAYGTWWMRRASEYAGRNGQGTS